MGGREDIEQVTNQGEGQVSSMMEEIYSRSRYLGRKEKQRRQQRSLKRNTQEIWKMLEDKKKKKEHSEEENCQEDSWQGNYLDGQIKGMTKNTGQSQKEIGGDRKEKEREGKEQWR